MLRDLNGWVGDRLREGMNGGFEVPEENDNGRRVIDFCAGRWERVEIAWSLVCR